MNLPCRSTLSAVRRSQLSLLSDHIDRLESGLDGIPTVDECLGVDTEGQARISDEDLAARYVELRERMDLLLHSLKRMHFKTCGRYAWELRQYAKE